MYAVLLLTILPGAFSACIGSSLDKIAKSFKKAEIVPQVIPAFYPSSFIYLEWENTTLDSPGANISKEATSKSPILTASHIPLTFPGPYIITTIDPDAPSRSKPSNAPFRHFLGADFYVSGYPSNKVLGAFQLLNSSEAVSDWYAPAPPARSGPHRYVTLLYRQPPGMNISFVDKDDRAKFNITEFAKKAGLGNPVAGIFFYVEVKEEKEGLETELTGSDGQVILGGM